MTKQEFEDRIGEMATTAEFEYANRVYMASNFQKDQFCHEWKNNATLKTSKLICDLVLEIETLRSNLDDCQKSYQNAVKGARLATSSMADFLIDQAEDTGAFAIREKAIKLIGIKEYLRRKLDAGYALWPDDRAALTEILTNDKEA